MRPFPKNWRLFLWILLACLTLPTSLCPLFGGALLSQTVKEKQRQALLFVADVVTKLEYNAEEDHVKRWVTPPKVSLFGDQSYEKVMTATLREINGAMPDDMQLKQLENGDEKATLKIYFVDYKDFEKVAAKHDFEYVEGNRGFFYVKWNGKYEIIDAVIMIARDKLAGAQLSHFTLEETIQSLGFCGDSERFPKSIFYENQARSEFGTATKLSPLDRKLVEFLYEHVPAGATAIEVGQLYERHLQP